MGVLKFRRDLSKAEFAYVANTICDSGMEFLSRLSARYGRLYVPGVVNLLDEISDNCQRADDLSILYGDPLPTTYAAMQKEYLLRAHNALCALDPKMYRIYRQLMQNPQGAFTTGKGDKVQATRAEELLDNMAQKLGELLDYEDNLIRQKLNLPDNDTVGRKRTLECVSTPIKN